MFAEKIDAFPSSPEGLTALFILLLVCPEQKKIIGKKLQFYSTASSLFYSVLPIFKGFPSKNRNICNSSSYLC